MDTPTMAAMRLPKMTLRGCASGEEGVAYSSTEVAPVEATSSTLSVKSRKNEATTIMPQNAHSPENSECNGCPAPRDSSRFSTAVCPSNRSRYLGGCTGQHPVASPDSTSINGFHRNSLFRHGPTSSRQPGTLGFSTSSTTSLMN